MSTTRFLTLQRSQVRMILLLAVLFTLIASALPQQGFALAAWLPVNGTITMVNNGPEFQVQPRISEGVVTYVNVGSGSSIVHYYSLLTGTDAAIPQLHSSLDHFGDINGSRVVYTHVTDEAYAINFLDINIGGNPIALDPDPSNLREKPVIGGNTIVWVDYGLSDNIFAPEIVVYDLTTGGMTRLTIDQAYDSDPRISPDGSLIVWMKCPTYLNSCDVWQAERNNNGWDVQVLTGSGEQMNPATDGHFVVYDSRPDNTTQDTNIFWQLRGGGEEHEILLPGIQNTPAIDHGVVTFASFNPSYATPNWDILLYEIQSGAGYRVSESATNENQPDVTVENDGLVRVVWTQDNAETSSDIYASMFRLPATVNHSPVIASITAPVDPVMINTTLSAAADFSDSDTTDTHTALWDWGDGATTPGVVNESNGSGTVSGSHTYTSPGVYQITLTVTDPQNASATAVFQYAVVYDPVGGFVTGSGWFDSPAGSYTANPSLTGKAHFGFVSRYQRGATFPSGRMNFNSKLAT